MSQYGQTNQGGGSAWNMAVAHVRGEVLALLDADDEWLPGKLRRQVDVLLADPD